MINDPINNYQCNNHKLLLWNHKKHIPSPSAELRVLCVTDLRLVFELIAELVHSSRLPIVEIDPTQSELRQRKQLAFLGYAVVVRVLPEPQAIEDGVKILKALRQIFSSILLSALWKSGNCTERLFVKRQANNRLDLR